MKEDFFDFIWCNGILHHTKDPYIAFQTLIKSLKNRGYVLIGLYNRFGRIRTIIRKYFYKVFGIKILNYLDPTVRNLKTDDKEIRSWIRDQYHHPIESLHTIDEILNWFSLNNIDYVNSIPSCTFEERVGDDLKKTFFNKHSKGNFFSRLLNQFNMIFNNLGSDGGLFVVIGKKNDQS